MMELKDLALICRSKNAGPFELTLDVVLRDRKAYEHVRNFLNAEVIGRLYQVAAADVLFTPYAVANAFKATIPRVRGAGDVGDTDVYGAQQHGPLMELQIPDFSD